MRQGCERGIYNHTITVQRQANADAQLSNSAVESYIDSIKLDSRAFYWKPNGRFSGYAFIEEITIHPDGIIDHSGNSTSHVKSRPSRCLDE